MKDSGFSLASIFLLTAVVAIFASGAKMATFAADPLEPDEIGCLAMIGMIVGLVVGGVIASRMEQGTPGRTLAVLTGLVFGPASGVLTVTGNALPVVLIGLAILFIFVWVVRWLSARPSDGEPL